MSRITRLTRGVAAAGLVVGAATVAEAQRSQPRPGLGAPEPPPSAPTIPYPGANVTFDPRLSVVPRQGVRHRALPRRSSAPVVVYVVPVPVGGGYHDDGYGYGVAPARGGVYDTNGRPMSSVGFDAAPALDAAPSYTPDLSGSPFVIVEGSAMLVSFPTGERRTFPACAQEDPDGRPRTIFYQGGPSGVVLRLGQRGRVLGIPATGVRACYAVDAWGRTVLEY